jgi:Uma2 family endonuclease
MMTTLTPTVPDAQPAGAANDYTALAPDPRARPAVAPIERLFTVEDLDALPGELPSGPVTWELDNGRLIAMSLTGDVHGGVEAKFTASLTYEGEFKGHGKVRCGEVGIILWREPADRVVGADVVFVATRSLPIKRSKEGWLETIPDLVVEVRSKNDTDASVEQKVKDYLLAGVRVVWVADPRKETVSVHAGSQPERILSGEELLAVEDIIPGLRIRVQSVFE